MYKGIIFDQDCTMYSFEKFIDIFAVQLASGKYSSQPSTTEFRDTYAKAVNTIQIGTTYNPDTFEEDPNGIHVKNPTWVPLLVARHFGFEGDGHKEYLKLYHNNILPSLHDEEYHLPTDRRFMDRMFIQDIRTALVSDNDYGDRGIRAMGYTGQFDFQRMPARKKKNFPHICEGIDRKFELPREEVLWVEDDTTVLELAKEEGFDTALRMCEGLRYKKEALEEFVDIFLPDSLRPLHKYMDIKH